MNRITDSVMFKTMATAIGKVEFEELVQIPEGGQDTFVLAAIAQELAALVDIAREKPLGPNGLPKRQSEPPSIDRLRQRIEKLESWMNVTERGAEGVLNQMMNLEPPEVESNVEPFPSKTPGDPWQAWALDMCSLLDRIEKVAVDVDASSTAEMVLDLTRGRFEMAKKHGLEIKFLGETTARDQ